ncbi:MAG: rod-binding protein [Spirochaetaceae bacterium]|nr:rod-binding protein [Spirochaetaceae bacterium]
MTGINGLSSGLSSITNGYAASQSANLQNEMSKFQNLLDTLMTENESSPKVVDSGRVNGEYTSGFAGTFKSDADKNALPSGFAANSASNSSKKVEIDKTSKLYEKSLELESYFVKIMLSSMKNTVQKSGLMGNDSHASKMYEDMLYDELAVSMTKSAGFGLADQIYMELV